MKIAGFFEELWTPSFGTPAGAARDFVADTAYEDADKIMSYLRAGHEIISTMGMAADALGSGEQFVGGDSLFTDGEWLWRGDLWHYVRLHHVTLPDEFLQRVRTHGYEVPEVERARLLEVRDFIRERW
ncbi:hypothetical protein ACWGQ5_00375 [Streptomyces sp. NPDC055722]